MNRVLGTFLGLTVGFLFLMPPAQAMRVVVARMLSGKVQVIGVHAERKAEITWQGTVMTMSTAGGTFYFRNGAVPTTCVGKLNDTVETAYIPVQNCVPTVVPSGFSSLLATGQTTAYQADKNDGIVGPVDVPDDGTLKLGLPLQYHDNGDGTVTDLNTGLIWEMKCSACGGLHDVTSAYRWSGNGSQETIWDWLDDVNSENSGAGFAGYSDWRIPNRRELESILDAELYSPAINSIFGATQSDWYWSSTSSALDPDDAWFVDFSDGFVDQCAKKKTSFIRAVRDGP